MFEKSSRYLLLGSGSSANSIEEDEIFITSHKTVHIWQLALKILTVSSFLLNLAFIIGIFGFERQTSNLEPTAFAGLTWDVPVPWIHNTEYASTNFTETYDLWKAVDFDLGMIALPNDYAESKGLHKSQAFPWDPKKGIYLVNAYHSIHCLKGIHASISEYNLNIPQTWPVEHITHCIDALRREVMCSADDTPRWTSQAMSGQSGNGQIRQCRDWSKLENWVAKYNSCYKRMSEDTKPEIERYKFCPPDSFYGKVMRAYFERVLHRIIE